MSSGIGGAVVMEAKEMAEQTVTRDMLEYRWRALMTKPRRFANEVGIAGDLSKAYYRIDRTLEDLACMLVDEVHEDEMDGTNGDSLREVNEAIWRQIENRLIDWALNVETKRAARRAEVAA